MPRRTGASAEGRSAAGRRKPAPKGSRTAAATGAGEETSRAGVGSRIRVTQVRSGIGHAATFKRTLRALGLKHHQDSVVVTDSPSIRGMIKKVGHLVKVEAVEE